jgi:hypothetical protein
MDVLGKKPSAPRGEHFRNNVWWWHPLWEYCNTVAPEICSDVLGHSNDGDGLPADGARKLAEYSSAYRREMDALPLEPCSYCENTGVRTDTVGTEMGMPGRELTDEQAERLGRTHGWCNGCDGEGARRSWAASYYFDESNVKEFVEFLAHSGGFRIY